MTRARRLALIALLVGAALLVVAYLRPVAVLREAGELWLRLSGVHSRYAQAGAYRLRYLEAGSGPPLLLVHGLGSNAAQDWGRLVAPLGFLMGMPFPKGLRATGSGPFPEPPLYWGMNGLFSVIGSMATMVTAVIFGFTWAMLGGAFFYLVAALSSRVLSAPPRGA